MSNTVSKGSREVIFKEGDSAEKLYLIKRGEVLCLKSSKDRLIPVFRATENDIIGESAMIEDLIYTYSAISLSNVELVEIPAKNFYQVMDAAPSWLADLTTTMIGRFQSTATLIAENRVISPLIIEEDMFPSTLEVEFKNLISKN